MESSMRAQIIKTDEIKPLVTERTEVGEEGKGHWTLLPS
jgi:hypothetical protein